MCGIVGAVRATASVATALIEGLRVLEYRGYDSAGVAVAEGANVRLAKREGRLANLEAAVAEGPAWTGTAGIGHTRWATHGPPSDLNAHPHLAGGGTVALVHNGILENHEPLRRELEAEGVAFRSQTDSEVLAHLFSKELAVANGDPVRALRAALARVEGSYACAALVPGPDGARIVCSRNGPPLVLARGGDGTWLASDLLALLPHAPEVVFLEEGDVACLDAEGFEVFGPDGLPIERAARAVDWEPEDSSKGQWPHHMLKEIHEQPGVLGRALKGKRRGGDVELEGFSDEVLSQVERVQVLACGTALHAGMVAAYAIEQLARVPVDVDYASEFRYRQPVVAPGTLALAISQSGETADTLAATRLARELGARVAAICNVQGSSQVREADAVVLTQAGPEIGVASTKAFTAQVAAAVLLAVRLGRAKGALGEADAAPLLDAAERLPAQAETLLTQGARDLLQGIARRHAAAKGFLFLGRGVNFPIALEGALKLKEISYVHAEGYAAGEMKHGPIALIDPGMTIVCLNGSSPLDDKMRSNVEQVKARGGVVLSVGSDPETHALASDVVEVPATHPLLAPILNVIPLQLFSYFVADLRGCDIDKPRNLAKSVTVE